MWYESPTWVLFYLHRWPAPCLLTYTLLQAEVNQGLQEGLEVLKQQKALAEALAQGRGEEVQGLKGQVKDLTGRLTEAEERLQQGELIRRKLHNTILVSLLTSYSKKAIT